MGSDQSEPVKGNAGKRRIKSHTGPRELFYNMTRQKWTIIKGGRGIGAEMPFSCPRKYHCWWVNLWGFHSAGLSRITTYSIPEYTAAIPVFFLMGWWYFSWQNKHEMRLPLLCAKIGLRLIATAVHSKEYTNRQEWSVDCETDYHIDSKWQLWDGEVQVAHFVSLWFVYMDGFKHVPTRTVIWWLWMIFVSN